MGGTESGISSTLGNWTVIQHKNYEYYSVVRDPNGQEGQQYNIPFIPSCTSSDRDTQLQIYAERKTAAGPIVHCYGVEHRVLEDSCLSDGLEEFRVITERITQRYCDVPQLMFNEILYVFDQALRGYEYLYIKAGCFDINGKMLGFTNQGELRVWHHQNYGRNSPQFRTQALRVASGGSKDKPSEKEMHMIRKIALIVQEKCESGKFPEQFRSSFENIGFTTAYRLIQLASSSLELPLPKRVDLHRNKVIIRAP